MEVLEAVIRDRTFPIVHERIVDSMKNMVGFQLEGEDISDLEEAELGERITDKYINSMVPRYEPAGINATQVVAENMTQSSLSSHRMAGVTKGASGFDRIKEIANMKNKSDIVRVITTPVRGIPRSRSAINEIANSMTRVTLDDLIHPTLRYSIVSERPVWYSLFIKMMNVPMQLIGKRWIRIYLNEYLLYKYRISMPVLYSTINDNLGTASVAILYPPAQLVENLYIDMHIKDNDSNDQEREYSLYSRLPDITSQIVGGISSVVSASPVGVNLLKDLQLIDKGDGSFEIRSSVPDFIPPTAWTHMLNIMVPSVEILSDNGRVFRSSLPEYQDMDRLRSVIISAPNSYEELVKSVSLHDDGTATVHIDRTLIDKYPFLEHVVMEDRTFNDEEELSDFLLLDITDFTTYWYVECVCSRAQDLYAISEVDATRTYTTAAINCMESLGYLAMRSMLYQEFKANISVDPSNVKLITNNMVLYRQPVSFKRQSLHNDKSEFLTSTTFEDVLKYSTQSAFTGEVDNMRSVSSHVLTGQMIQVGGGGSRLNAENSYLKARRESRPKK